MNDLEKKSLTFLGIDLSMYVQMYRIYISTVNKVRIAHAFAIYWNDDVTDLLLSKNQSLLLFCIFDIFDIFTTDNMLGLPFV